MRRRRRPLTEKEAPNSSPLERYLGRKRGEDGKLEPKPKKKRQKPTVSATVFSRTIAETQEMIRTREWGGCSARHLVALYELMHRKCYGVEAGMSASDLHLATVRMGGFANRNFDGDYLEVVAYFRWLWTRELGKERYCRENGFERNTRIGFGLILTTSFLADYRVQLARQRRPKRSS